MAPIAVFRSGDRKRTLAFVFFYVSVDDSADVVVLVFFFLEETVVFLFVVAKLVIDIFDVVRGICIDNRHTGAFGFRFGIGCFLVFVLIVIRGDDQRRFLDLSLFFGFLGLDFLVLVLIVFVAFDDGGGSGRLRRARTALLVQRLGLEAEFALRAFDRTFLKVVKTRAARGAYALNSQISLDQSYTSRV